MPYRQEQAAWEMAARRLQIREFYAINIPGKGKISFTDETIPSQVSCISQAPLQGSRLRPYLPSYHGLFPLYLSSRDTALRALGKELRFLQVPPLLFGGNSFRWF
jgi:hypothetical protein